MCEHALSAEAAALPAPPRGSRRRRVWELAEHAYCPVIGVCLPVDALRRLAAKLLGGEVLASDYELHCGVIGDCKQRTPMAEAVQRELDRRYASALRLSAARKNAEALAAWWREAPARGDVAGALWATLSHARCDAVLEEQVLQDVHMLQHQVGAAARADLRRLAELQRSHAELAHELAQQRRRAAEAALAHARRQEDLQATVLQLRADLIGRDTRIAMQDERLRDLEASAPGLKSRLELLRDNERQLERIRELQRALQRTEQALAQERRRAEPRALPATSPPAEPAPREAAGPRFEHRAVLCVGGRPASVPAYRALIERVGGRFLHHDGGEEDSVAKLDATLGAADLVICQTGCLSHDAYWRVKSHCKRTGKRCVFVENPSATSLQRALDTLPAADPAAEAATQEPR